MSGKTSPSPSPYDVARAVRTLAEADYRPEDITDAAIAFTSSMLKAGHDPTKLAAAIKAGRAAATGNSGNEDGRHRVSIFTRLLYVNNHRDLSKTNADFHLTFLETMSPGSSQKMRRVDIEQRLLDKAQTREDVVAAVGDAEAVDRTMLTMHVDAAVRAANTAEFKHKQPAAAAKNAALAIPQSANRRHLTQQP